MKCPYCVSQIDAQALACPHCARDLYLFKPLLARIETLEADLGEARARLLALEAEAEPPAAAAAPGAPVAPSAAWPAWGLLLPALVLLLAAHFLIVVALDLHTLWLRLASLAIPLPFGYALLRGGQRGLARSLLLAGLVALVAVTGMSAVVALVDGTPVLPVNGRGWREFLYYAVSIMLSFGTGMIVSLIWGRGGGTGLARLYKSALLLRLFGTLWGAARDPAMLQKQVEAMRNLIGTVAATATAVASVTSGLSGVLGG